MRKLFFFIKPMANRYIGFLMFLFVYTMIMQRCGGLFSVLTNWRLEIPLLLYLYYYFNLITRKSRLQCLLAGVPVLLVYGIFDFYYLQLGGVLRLIEVTELPELFLVMPFGAKIFIGLLLGMPIIAFLLSVQLCRFRQLLLGTLPLLAILVAVERYPEFFMAAFEGTHKKIDWMSDAESLRSNGRVSMALYNEARRKSCLKKTAAYRGDSFFKRTFDDTVVKVRTLRTKHNVHLIVLESFIDPNLFREAHFSRNPIHPSFDSFFKGKGGFSVSPVFGGATAQAEFEILSGVPAMQELSGIEFNVFTGAKTLCLPNLLAQGGFHTVATNAFLPDFFNSLNAYEGMGFERIFFPRDYAPRRETYFSTGDVTGERYMFDGNLFTQNLAFVAKWFKENPGRPVFNYIIGIYGHTPHDINTEKRPKVVKMLGKVRDYQLERAVNQCYYRTKAIASFVKELIRIDPKSIIILVSDHLPPLTYGPNTYRDLNYLGKSQNYIHMNRIYIVENGQPVHYDTIHHYDIPRLILSYVTQAKYDHKVAAKTNFRNVGFSITDFHEQYMAIMANAMNEEPLFSPIE
ncbi:MAG: sulfatase-like hydrolase/transferase [Deltaproteobacteria bacterium]|nr:sulfatase-like hydrolase/transferase [Deltaproteobacteria bacterium]